MKRWWLVALGIIGIAATPAALHAQQAASQPEIGGKWHFVLDTPDGARDFDADLTVDADGKVGGVFGTSKASGIYKDGHLLLDFPATDDQSGETAELKIDSKLEDPATLSGTWQFSSYDGTFRAFRPKKEGASQ